jgi:hypothetical protein
MIVTRDSGGFIPPSLTSKEDAADGERSTLQSTGFKSKKKDRLVEIDVLFIT